MQSSNPLPLYGDKINLISNDMKQNKITMKVGKEKLVTLEKEIRNVGINHENELIGDRLIQMADMLSETIFKIDNYLKKIN